MPSSNSRGTAQHSNNASSPVIINDLLALSSSSSPHRSLFLSHTVLEAVADCGIPLPRSAPLGAPFLPESTSTPLPLLPARDGLLRSVHHHLGGRPAGQLRCYYQRALPQTMSVSSLTPAAALPLLPLTTSPSPSPSHLPALLLSPSVQSVGRSPLWTVPPQ